MFKIHPLSKLEEFISICSDQDDDELASVQQIVMRIEDNTCARAIIITLRACSHEPGTVNYPGVMVAPGQALPRAHMMICCSGTTLPRGKFNVI